MKKAILFLVTVLFINFINAQEHKEYYDNGNIKERGYYDENDYKTGKWKKYYESGQLKETTVHLISGKMLINIYYKNGQLNGTYSLKSNKSLDRIGAFKRYFENGQIDIDGFYKNITQSMKSGEWKWYYENGNIKSKVTYFNDKKNGECYDYYENGKLERTQLFIKNGTLSEVINYYDSKGNSLDKGTVKNGTGILKKYNQGILSKNVTYKNGKTSSIEEFYDNGKLKKHYNYNIEGEELDGELDGEWKEYYKNGHLKTLGMYSIILFPPFNQTGKNDTWKYYHKNGKLRMIGKLDNGEKLGEWKEYDENGNLLKIETYN